VPVISSAWERVLATQCQEAKAAAVAHYEAEMKTNLKQFSQRFHANSTFPLPENMLTSAHQAAKTSAKSIFWSKVFL